MLRKCYSKGRLLPAAILTMCEENRQFLKRKFSDISEVMTMNYAAAAWRGKHSQNVPSGGTNTGQTYQGRQGTSGRDDRKTEQPFNSDQSHRGRAGNHGANNQQRRQNSSNLGKQGNNQSSSRGGRDGRNYRRGSKGKGGGSHETFNRNQAYDGNRHVFEEPELSFDNKHQSQSSHHQRSATNTTQRSRENSESKDRSAWKKEPPKMSHLFSDTSTWPQSSASPTKAQSQSGSEGMCNQSSQLTVESPPSSDQDGKCVPVTQVKSLSISDPAIHSIVESKEEMDALIQSKKPPGLPDADFYADKKKKSGSRSEDTVQRNVGRDLNDTKKLKSQESGKETVWKGVPISKLKRAPECLNESASSQATDIESADVRSARPESQEHREKKFPVPSFVHLPHHQAPGVLGPNFAWQNIEQILQRKILDCWDLEEALRFIASFNPPHSQHRRYNNPQHNPSERLDFNALQAYFKTLTREESDYIFQVTIPSMQKLALRLPYLFQEPLRILKQRHNQEITLSQEQAACLLAHAFFNTFPQRMHNAQEGKPLQMPDFNFINLYGQMKCERKVEKLKCIMNYFSRVTVDMPDGNVTYRRVYRDTERWLTMEKKLTDLHVSCEGTIEDARGFLQADFANKFVGGGVLNTGLVQEEIRFVLCPEMIVSRLITEMLASDEVLVMIGCERFNSYSGYSDTFKFTGNYFDDTKRDAMKRKYTEVVAMDAAVFRDNFYEQFDLHHVQRELNKAHCAFKGNSDTNLPAVCTGNWGCGAFGGDKQLKALIQFMAASVANRDICYLTFGDTDLCQQIGHIYDILKTRDIVIKDIMKILTDYSHSKTNDSVFTFIEKNLTANVNRPEKSARSDFPKNENVQSSKKK